MPPYVPFAPLTLAPDAPIDLQTHTTLSDGRWSASELLDHGASEGFALVAITDHDRPDTVDEIQRLAAAHGVHVIPAAEMSSKLGDDLFDILCFGIHPGPSDLATIAADTRRRQIENVQQAYARLQRDGYVFPRAPEVLAADQAGQPEQLDDLIALMSAHGYGDQISPALKASGFQWITAEAAHAMGALAVIAHPGRGDGFVRLDADQLDRLRATIPIDGIEAYYPTHTPEQVQDFLAYARSRGLLVSAGSDAHGPHKTLPIKYPAETCRALLARLGITVG